jgi:hypothetical protein
MDTLKYDMCPPMICVDSPALHAEGAPLLKTPPKNPKKPTVGKSVANKTPATHVAKKKPSTRVVKKPAAVTKQRHATRVAKKPSKKP